MSGNTIIRISGIVLLLRQLIFLGIAVYGGWSLYSADPQTDSNLWINAVLVWVGVTVFFLGWQGHLLKTLLLTAGAWVGVMVPIAIAVVVLAMIVGSLGDGDQNSQYIALVPIPIALYYIPKLDIIWPNAEPVKSVTQHALRASFCLLQFVCAGLLVATLVIVKPGDFQKKDAASNQHSYITYFSPFVS